MVGRFERRVSGVVLKMTRRDNSSSLASLALRAFQFAMAELIASYCSFERATDTVFAFTFLVHW